jgi:hypothetical protein
MFAMSMAWLVIFMYCHAVMNSLPERSIETEVELRGIIPREHDLGYAVINGGG